MPYFVQKEGRTYRITYREGRNVARAISKKSPEAASLGFRPEMTFEEARRLAKKLQAEKALERQAAAQERARSFAVHDLRLETAYFQPGDVEEFERTREIKKPGHWRKAKKIISKAGDPELWAENKAVIVRLLIRDSVGSVYARSLIRLMNRWGVFYSKKYKRFYEAVKLDPSHWVAIKAAAEKNRRVSKPLSPELLLDKKSQLDRPEYNWLFVSVWLSLRPEEIDYFQKDDKNLWYIEEDVLYVFQLKLYRRGVQEQDCWKAIPIWRPEQRLALQIIEPKELRRPTLFKIHAAFGKGYGLYSGRNNFVSMMEELGQDIRTIQQWMGHLNLATTERYGRKKRRVALPK